MFWVFHVDLWWFGLAFWLFLIVSCGCRLRFWGDFLLFLRVVGCVCDWLLFLLVQVVLVSFPG